VKAQFLIASTCLLAAAGSSQQPAPPGVGARLGLPPVVALAPVTAAEIAKAKASAGIREAVGVRRLLPASVAKKGRWAKLKDGTPLWRLAIRSPGAAGLRVHFQNFEVGRGMVWVYSGQPDQPGSSGPFSSRGLDEQGDFWSGVVESELLIVEYKADRPYTSRRTLPFRLTELSHLWRSLP
jgi:hypothetical protein